MTHYTENIRLVQVILEMYRAHEIRYLGFDPSTRTAKKTVIYPMCSGRVRSS
jgi:hypothetical protein